MKKFGMLFSIDMIKVHIYNFMNEGVGFGILRKEFSTMVAVEEK